MNEIKDNLFDLYASYHQHKALFEFYQQNKKMRTVEEIKERIEYIKKNKVKQRNELEVLMWVIKEIEPGEKIE